MLFLSSFTGISFLPSWPLGMYAHSGRRQRNSGFDGLQRGLGLFHDIRRQRDIAEIRSGALPIAQAPGKKVAKRLGFGGVTVVLAEKNPSERSNGVSVGPQRVGNINAEILRHLRRVKCRLEAC